MKSTRIIAITLTAIMTVTAFSGCANNANKNSPSYVENNRKVTLVATTNSSDDRISASEAETTSISVTSTKANTTKPVETTVTSTKVTEASAPVTTKPVPEWTETKAEGKRYLAVSCYSRKKAVLGAETVKLYDINDEVTVTAITDTGYYKLKDGTFIHSDYLNEEKVVMTTVVTTTTTTTVTTPAPKPVPITSSMKKEDKPKPVKNGKYISSGYEPLDNVIFPLLDKLIKNNMSDADKLRAIYNYLMQYRYAERVVLIPQNKKQYAEQLYAMSLFEKGYGICYDFTGAFTYMSRAIGFETRMIYGYHTNPSGGAGEHTWAEIDINGTTYIFDPAIELLIGGNASSRFMRTYSEIGHYYIFN